MNFGFTEEQDLLRDQIRKFLDTKCPLAEVRKISKSKQGHSDELWREMAELGWLGLLIPEEYGGVGLGWIDLIVLMEETGRFLYPSPLISHSLCAMAIIENGNDTQKQKWLPQLASGAIIGAIALQEEDERYDSLGVQLSTEINGTSISLSGGKHYVSDVAEANLVVCACRTGFADSDVSLVLVETAADGVTNKAATTMDATKREGVLTLDNVIVSKDALLGVANKAWPAIERLNDCGAVAVTAEAVGAAEQALQITTNYAKERIQFGNQIGKYQSVKHPLAQMYVDIESFKSLSYFAAWNINESPEDLPRSVSLAKGYAADVLPQLGIDCLGLHGAIGYTAEYDIQLYLKRTKWIRPKFGDADYHFDRVINLGGVE